HRTPSRHDGLGRRPAGLARREGRPGGERARGRRDPGLLRRQWVLLVEPVRPAPLRGHVRTVERGAPHVRGRTPGRGVVRVVRRPRVPRRRRAVRRPHRRRAGPERRDALHGGRRGAGVDAAGEPHRATHREQPVSEPGSAAPGTRAPGHVPALDGVRGIAVALVVLFHLGVPGFGGGDVGVDAFFVLSGFLITSLLLAEIESNGRVSLWGFWLRRARRLLPALVVLLLVVAAVAAFGSTFIEKASLRGDLLSTAAYAANWHFISTSH